MTYHPYSDFVLDHMGARLADGINQGAAGADQFPYGSVVRLGAALFFLHDGRTTDLVQATKSHYFATNSYCTQTSSTQLLYVLTTSSGCELKSSTDVCNSEANAVIDNYNSLSISQQQDLLNFLRSL